MSCTLHRVLLPVSPGKTEPVLTPIYSLTLCLDDDSSGRCVLNLLLLADFLGTLFFTFWSLWPLCSHSLLRWRFQRPLRDAEMLIIWTSISISNSLPYLYWSRLCRPSFLDEAYKDEVKANKYFACSTEANKAKILGIFTSSENALFNWYRFNNVH